MMPRSLRTAVPFALAIVLSAGAAVAGGPSTPLGKWMKANMGAPLAGQDFAAVGKGFDTVAGKPPASGDYAQWASIAKGGSAAAAKSDLAGVKGACKQCHDTYREKYKKDFPTTPFP